MNSYYDITNPDISFDWLHEVLHMKQGGLIDEYCLVVTPLVRIVVFASEIRFS